MTIVFASSGDTRPRLVARLVAEGSLPADLAAPVREAAAASRFTGKTGQVFEAFTHDAGGLTAKDLALARACDGQVSDL